MSQLGLFGDDFVKTALGAVEDDVCEGHEPDHVEEAQGWGRTGYVGRETFKVCPDCGVGYPAREPWFTNDSRGTHGSYAHCKKCHNARRAAAAAARRAAGECRSCKERRSASVKYARSGTAESPHSQCWECATKRCWSAADRDGSGRGLKCDITHDEWRTLCSEGCSYCGRVAHGLDRIDDCKGYLIGNVVPSCVTCNVERGSTKYEDWVAWVQKLRAEGLTVPEWRQRETDRRNGNKQ